MRKRASGVPGIPLKESVHGLRLAVSEHLMISQGQKGKNELSGFRAGAGGAAISQTDVLAGSIVSLLSPPPTELEEIGEHLI